MLENGTFAVPLGKIAAVVTHFETTVAPDAAPEPREGFMFERLVNPSLKEVRTLFRQIGAPWLWFSLLVADDAKAAAEVAERTRAFYVVKVGNNVKGLVELETSAPDATEIVLFGLDQSAIGQGVGRWMMQHALHTAWNRAGVERVWLHTCTWDSPQALPFYRAMGFQPIRQEIEIKDDPRLSGVLPMDAGSHIPILAP